MKNKLEKSIFITLILLIGTSVELNAQLLDWAVGISGTGTPYAQSVAIDENGNVYSTGDFDGTIDLDPGTGTFNLTSVAGYNSYILKLDPSGNFIWAKQISGTGSGCYPYIKIDANGSLIIAGTYSDTIDLDPGVGVFNLVSTGIQDVFISKFDPSGNFLWGKTIGGPQYVSIYALTLDASGNIYTTGGYTDTVDFDPGIGVYNVVGGASSGNIFISKLDSTGNFVLAKGFVGNSFSTYGQSIAVDAAQNIYTTGQFIATVDFDPGVGVVNLVSFSTTYQDIFISKLDSLGNYVWAKNIGGSISSSSGTCYGTGVALDTLGNIFVSGNYVGTLDFNPNAGVAYLASNGNFDAFLLKLDVTGAYVWAKTIGGIDYDYGNAIIVDATGNISVMGTFNGTADFDPSSGLYNLTSFTMSDDIYISKYTSSGNLIWAAGMGSIQSDYPAAFAQDTLGSIYCTGNFSATADFDPSSLTYLLNPVGGSDAFIFKLFNISTEIEEQDENIDFQVYPNPSKGNFYINSVFTDGDLEIYNLLGERIFSQKVVSGSFEINISDEPKGIYFVKIIVDQKMFTRKIVIQ